MDSRFGFVCIGFVLAQPLHPSLVLSGGYERKWVLCKVFEK